MAAARRPRARARARNEIVRLVHRITGVHRFGRDMMRVVERAVSFDAGGLLTVDPATLLLTGEVADPRVGVSDGVRFPQDLFGCGQVKAVLGEVGGYS